MNVIGVAALAALIGVDPTNLSKWLSAAAARQRRRSVADAADRRAVHGPGRSGSRRMAAMLRADGYGINCKHMQRLMRRMGIAALGPWFDRLTMSAKNDEVRAGTQNLPVSPARLGMRVPLPRRGHRLGEPGGAGVAAVEHHGRVVLHLGARGCKFARNSWTRKGGRVWALTQFRCSSSLDFEQAGSETGALLPEPDACCWHNAAVSHSWRQVH
jgi:hypothetical protein